MVQISLKKIDYGVIPCQINQASRVTILNVNENFTEYTSTGLMK